MTMHEQINSLFPVRKTKAQKEAFRQWVLETAKAHGYDAAVVSDRCLCMNHNVVIGDPDKAEVLITAHYDTPAAMPIPNFITPRNIPVYLAYQMLVVLVMLVVSVGISAVGAAMNIGPDACFWLSWTACMSILLLMMIGPANRHNANDNTSGVAAVMQLMAQLPEEMRGKAAFILFDNEEKGVLGSAAYVSKRKKLRMQKLVINLDCVGVGEDILFFVPKKTRLLPAHEQLKAAMLSQEGKTVHFFPMEKSMYPSDQANFTHGIAVCACKRHKTVGFYCSRIHTKKDVDCDQGCLDVLSDGLKAFVATL